MALVCKGCHGASLKRAQDSRFHWIAVKLKRDSAQDKLKAWLQQKCSDVSDDASVQTETAGIILDIL